MATRETRIERTINRRQFNYLLSVGLGLVRVDNGRMRTFDFVKALGLKIKFPIKVGGGKAPVPAKYFKDKVTRYEKMNP